MFESEEQEIVFDLSQKQNNPIKEYNPENEISEEFDRNLGEEEDFDETQ